MMLIGYLSCGVDFRQLDGWLPLLTSQLAPSVNGTIQGALDFAALGDLAAGPPAVTQPNSPEYNNLLLAWNPCS